MCRPCPWPGILGKGQPPPLCFLWARELWHPPALVLWFAVPPQSRLASRHGAAALLGPARQQPRGQHCKPKGLRAAGENAFHNTAPICAQVPAKTSGCLQSSVHAAPSPRAQLWGDVLSSHTSAGDRRRLQRVWCPRAGQGKPIAPGSIRAAGAGSSTLTASCPGAFLSSKASGPHPRDPEPQLGGPGGIPAEGTPGPQLDGPRRPPGPFLSTPPQSRSGSNDLPCSCPTTSQPVPARPSLSSALASPVPALSSPGSCPKPHSRVPVPLPQLGHPLPGQGCGALASLSALRTTWRVFLKAERAGQRCAYLKRRSQAQGHSTPSSSTCGQQRAGTASVPRSAHAVPRHAAPLQPRERGGWNPQRWDRSILRARHPQDPARGARSPAARTGSCPRHSSVHPPCTPSPPATPAPPHPTDRPVCFPEESRGGSDPHQAG